MTAETDILLSKILSSLLESYTLYSELLSSLLESYAKYNELIDEVDANTTYHCLAEPGTSTSSAKWRIRKISIVATVTTIAWADGNAEFDNIADNRLTLTYS